MNTFSRVPPGFRFHPTDEELVDYYLRKKVTSRRIDLDVIKDVDLYKIEPWDLQELCRLGTDEQNEWYFFSHKDKKYPTGTRTNRATAAGFWKATGRDKAIYAKQDLIGMRKTLVFYKGRAPNGQKSDWIMHEYRLETDENGAPQEEGWVVCRVFKKRLPTLRKASDHESPCWYDEQPTLFMHALDSPKQNPNPNLLIQNHLPYALKKELDHLQLPYNIPHQHILQLPLLNPPSAAENLSCNSMSGYGIDVNHVASTTDSLQSLLFGCNNNNNNNSGGEPASVDNQVTDWRVLDKLVASQLSQVDVPKDNSTYTRATPTNMFQLRGDHTCDLASGQLINKEEMMSESDSIPPSIASSSQIELWK